MLLKVIFWIVICVFHLRGFILGFINLSYFFVSCQVNTCIYTQNYKDSNMWHILTCKREYTFMKRQVT